jgi:DNA primase
MKPTEVHELEQQMEALAREYAETHDQKIIAAMKGRQRKGKSFVDSCSA